MDDKLNTAYATVSRAKAIAEEVVAAVRQDRTEGDPALFDAVAEETRAVVVGGEGDVDAALFQLDQVVDGDGLRPADRQSVNEIQYFHGVRGNTGYRA